MKEEEVLWRVGINLKYFLEKPEFYLYLCETLLADERNRIFLCSHFTVEVTIEYLREFPVDFYSQILYSTDVGHQLRTDRVDVIL